MRATTSIEPSRTTIRRFQTTVAADLRDPGFTLPRNPMNNEMIEPLLSNCDHSVYSTILAITAASHSQQALAFGIRAAVPRTRP
jgi:hypothetical protein